MNLSRHRRLLGTALVTLLAQVSACKTEYGGSQLRDTATPPATGPILISPAEPGPNVPPTGRSYFDRMHRLEKAYATNMAGIS